MRTSVRWLLVAAAVATLAATLAANATARDTTPYRGPVAEQINALDILTRASLYSLAAVTQKYHSVEAAIADGYLPPPPGGCVASPLGGMGYHFENPALMEDGVLDFTRPEMLLYERDATGAWRLIGVEYYIEADQVTQAPVLFGQTFQGPMPAHHPGMETHYDLHVWLWKFNPSGLFAEWNPLVTCP